MNTRVKQFDEMTGFNEFWSLYPRKKDKLDARKAWAQMVREYGPDEIISGLRLNLQSLQSKDKQYVKYPAGWLRKGGWMDEPEELKPQTFADIGRGKLNGRQSNGGTDNNVQYLAHARPAGS